MNYQLILSKTILFSIIVAFASCIGEEEEIITPKPRSYFRLNFPEKKYVTYDSLCPFIMEIPTYSVMEHDYSNKNEPCWMNLQFPSFNGTLHLSYKSIEDGGKIEALFEDSYTLASKHQIKASGILEQLIAKDSSEVYGLIYEIEGNAASAIQFYLTDSSKHFLRGALYFNEVPNIDSIAPVIDFVKEDIYHIIETFEWK